MLLAWRRIDLEKRRSLWQRYGWFCALIMFGSCFGAVAWAAWNRVLFYFYVANKKFPGSITKAQQVMLYAYAYPWRAVFAVTYAVEFLCLSVAKLMVLDRMLNFMVLLTGNPFWRRWVSGWQIVMGVVVAGNLVGLCGNIAAAVYYDRVAQSFQSASASYTDNTTLSDAKGYNSYHATADSQTKFAHSVAAVQSISEVAVLVLIVSGFLAAGISCVKHIRYKLSGVKPDSESSVSGKSLMRQLAITTGTVFVAFLLRSAFSAIYAAAHVMNDYDKTTVLCPGTNWRCDPKCNNVYSHIVQWMNFTPQFQLSVVFFSSPVALLVSLWGMTSNTMLRLMRSDSLPLGTGTSSSRRPADISLTSLTQRPQSNLL
jgi:hypothetical protein